jgi:hypothetical protein
VRLEGETVWLTINQMAELFQVDKSSISKHLKNIYKTGELVKNRTVAKIATVQKEGKRDINREIEFYNLDAIISVGYRINTIRGTQFRIWATERLREYIVKGFALNDDHFKQAGGGIYFDELLARIRDIRSSEKVFWRKVLDIYATSIDYDPSTDMSREFFATVQNKMHWAAHGHTAAEIIFQRVDSTKTHMGLTTWAGTRLRKADAEVAKNYLNDEELNMLNRIVTSYLELAELQALSRRPMYMKDWIKALDDFLKLGAKEILTHSGCISHDNALKKAHVEYEKYKKLQLSQPTLVEKDFVIAVEQVNRLDE